MIGSSWQIRIVDTKEWNLSVAARNEQNACVPNILKLLNLVRGLAIAPSRDAGDEPVLLELCCMHCRTRYRRRTTGA